MYGYIYLTTNVLNGKMYIGQKKSSRFLGNNYLGSGLIMSRAIMKYDRENFEVKLLEEVDGDKNDLDAREKYWISYYDAVKSGMFYNVLPGGQGGDPMPYLDPERVAQIRQNHSEFMRNNFHHSNETKKRMSDIRRGTKRSDETKAKISNALRNTDRHVSDDWKSKKADTNRNSRWMTDGTNDKFVRYDQIDNYLKDGWKFGRSKASHRTR